MSQTDYAPVQVTMSIRRGDVHDRRLYPQVPPAAGRSPREHPVLGGVLGLLRENEEKLGFDAERIFHEVALLPG